MAWSGKDLDQFKQMVSPEALARNPQLAKYLREAELENAPWLADPLFYEKEEAAHKRRQSDIVMLKLMKGNLISEYEARYGTYHG